MESVCITLPESVENLKLPAPELVAHYQDLEERVVWIDYEIDEELLSVSRQIMRWNREDAGIPVEQRKPIKILIFTYGGRLDSTFNFIDICALSKTPIITINAGIAISAGFLILLAGHKRYALSHSKAMAHKGSGGVGGSYDECEAGMEDYKKYVAMMKDYILERSDIPKATFTRKASKDWYMYADEQLQYHIVDKIIDNLDQIIA